METEEVDLDIIEVTADIVDKSRAINENETNLFHTSESVVFNNLESEPLAIEKKKLVRLPLARIKQMMKMDPECGMISQDALFLVTKATELFIELLSRETVKQTLTTKRKTVLKKDVDGAIDCTSQLCFLDGALE